MRIPELAPNLESLLKRHGETFPEILDPKFRDLTRRCETQYLPWQKLKFVARAEGLDAERVWLIAKMLREPRYKWLELKGKDRPLRYVINDYLQYELMRIDQELAGGLTSDDDAPPSNSQKERFIISALREEAIASSMLEGAATTRQEARQMLKSGRRPRSRGEQMVKNNYQAIQFIRENKDAGLSPEFLLELQKILTDKTLDDPGQIGRFRTAADKIEVVDHRDNEVLHIPPPASELRERLDALCAFGNRTTHSKDFIHPVIAACVLHFQIGYDHPFCDGNGRTARAIFYWMMLRNGYWLFEYLPISNLIYRAPLRYARAFLYCETDDFDVTYFLKYHVRLIEKARQALKEHISRQQKQVAQAKRIFVADSRLNHRQREVILFAARNTDRHFTIANHKSRHQVTYATARSDFLKLAKWKYLKKIVVGKRFEFIAGERVLNLEQELD